MLAGIVFGNQMKLFLKKTQKKWFIFNWGILLMLEAFSLMLCRTSSYPWPLAICWIGLVFYTIHTAPFDNKEYIVRRLFNQTQNMFYQKVKYFTIHQANILQLRSEAEDLHLAKSTCTYCSSVEREEYNSEITKYKALLSLTNRSILRTKFT